MNYADDSLYTVWRNNPDKKLHRKNDPPEAWIIPEKNNGSAVWGVINTGERNIWRLDLTETGWEVYFNPPPKGGLMSWYRIAKSDWYINLETGEKFYDGSWSCGVPGDADKSDILNRGNFYNSSDLSIDENSDN